MNLLSRVVWSEGMYLGPHHFQVQSRYFEDSIQFATSSLWYASYGLAGVELDAEALHNGTVALLHARGIFRDGLPFNMPESDVLPEPRAIADLFPPTRDGIVVTLAIPPRKPDGFNCSLADGEAAEARYTAEARVLHDENTGADERTVQLGRKNLRLLLDTEPAGDLLTMPVARVVRDGSGHFAYDANFVPPVLRISASTRLMLLVQRLIEILDDKSVTISRGAHNTSGGTAEFSTRQIASFWLMHAVNSALTPLRHQFIAKRGHPEELYVEMSRLAGALCTFALDSHPRDLPLYDHDDLGPCFTDLDDKLRLLLETVVPSNFISLPLKLVQAAIYATSIDQDKYLVNTKMYLAVNAEMNQADLINKTPHLVKVCSANHIEHLVRQALPGVPLTHVATPPSSIPMKLNFQYFSMSQTGLAWEAVTRARNLAAYVPGDFPNPQLELIILLPQAS